MCGRYTLTAPAEDLAERFLLDLSELGGTYQPRYNVAPSQQVLAVAATGARPTVQWVRWGLTPSWSRDGAPGPINARCETVFSKPMFHHAVRQRRCLVPADGFYEWAGKPPHRSPRHFLRKDGGLFAFAGIWEQWQGPDGAPVASVCLLTTTANELVAPIHDRMPVILRQEQESVWLDPTLTDAADLAPLLTPLGAEQMQVHEVSRLVNDPRLDTPECIRAVD